MIHGLDGERLCGFSKFLVELWCLHCEVLWCVLQGSSWVPPREFMLVELHVNLIVVVYNSLDQCASRRSLVRRTKRSPMNWKVKICHS